MIDLAGPLTPALVVAVADGEPVTIDEAALARVADAADRASRANGPVYGRTTGVGALRGVAVTDDDEHARRLLRSHAVDAGEPLPARVVRAMLAVRIHQLAQAGSGIEPHALEGLVTMLADDALPQVRRLGSVGTGDLAALAATGLTLLGERPASRPLVPLTRLGAASALALMSSSALTLGRACLVLDELTALARAAESVTALSALALRANPQAWSAQAAAASTAPQVAAVAGRLRALVGQSLAQPARVQDPYGLRVAAIVGGGLQTALDAADERVTALIGAAQENPLFVPDETDARASSNSDAPASSGTEGPASQGGAHAVHHGAFFQADLAQRFDAVRLALAAVADLGLARLTHLHDPALTGLTTFLAQGPAGSSGHMMVEYVAADAAHDVRLAAAPASLGSAHLSRGLEESAPFAAHAVDACERAVAGWRVVLACELLSARRALRLAGVDVPPALAVLGRDADGTDADHDLRLAVDAALVDLGSVT